MLSIQTPMGLSSFVVEKCATTAPTALLSAHGTLVPAAARVRAAAVAAFGADLPGPPRGAPV